MIQLDWEEGLFRGLQKAWQLVKKQPPPPPPQRVVLAEVEGRCRSLAQLVSGQPVRILASEGVGGVRGTVLLLPAFLEHEPTREANLALYLLRATISAAMVAFLQEPRDPLSDRLLFLAALSAALRDAEQQLPQFATSFREAVLRELALRPQPEGASARARALDDLRRLVLLGGSFDLEAEKKRLAGPLPTDLIPAPWLCGDVLTPMDEGKAVVAETQALEERPPREGSEFQAPPKDHINRTVLPKDEEVEPLPLHTFEKTETLETHKGGSRTVDGEDELEDHLEALEELDLREVVRDGRDTQGLYRADLDLGSEIPDVHHILAGERGIPYPEWNYKTRSYRPAWVTVFATPVQGSNEAEARQLIQSRQPLIRDLRNRLQAHREKNCRLSRQIQGDEIDLDAVVTARADHRAGRDPGERMYIQNRKIRRDIAVTVLFDISLSAGSWVDGRRVLDVTREAVLVLGEVAEALGDLFRVQCFASNTRNHCRVFDLKAWREPWSRALGRVMAIEPQGYTRVGPALRHALAGFRGIQAKSQLLLVITDGKPTDYDRYEGRYGREDIRAAIREAKDQGVHCFALALDPKAEEYLPSMFGHKGWQVLRHPEALPQAAFQAYARQSSR